MKIISISFLTVLISITFYVNASEDASAVSARARRVQASADVFKKVSPAPVAAPNALQEAVSKYDAAIDNFGRLDSDTYKNALNKIQKLTTTDPDKLRPEDQLTNEERADLIRFIDRVQTIQTSANEVKQLTDQLQAKDISIPGRANDNLAKLAKEPATSSGIKYGIGRQINVIEGPLVDLRNALEQYRDASGLSKAIYNLGEKFPILRGLTRKISGIQISIADTQEKIKNNFEESKIDIANEGKSLSDAISTVKSGSSNDIYALNKLGEKTSTAQALEKIAAEQRAKTSSGDMTPGQLEEERRSESSVEVMGRE